VAFFARLERDHDAIEDDRRRVDVLRGRMWRCGVAARNCDFCLSGSLAR
jgi:hypothetical protein